MATIIVKKHVSHRLKAGHLWIYKTDIQKIRGNPLDGDVVNVQDYKTRFLGQGFINQKSEIVCRLLTSSKEEINVDFFRYRIETALKSRRTIVENTNAYRMIYSEADLLPGLIVDKYDNILVVQFLTLGMENHKKDILQILDELVKPTAIFQRHDLKTREYEGLPKEKGWLSVRSDSIIKINENGIDYWVDIENGQKTGFYLDQRENRKILKNYLPKNARVLDAFCYTGGFSLTATQNGARSVIGIDYSPEAVAMAQRNMQLNGLEHICTFKSANAFDELHRMASENMQFDMIILDPPAFTKSKTAIPSAFRGYKEINLRAMQLLATGGILLTCSCSQHISAELFYRILIEAARDAGKRFCILERLTQAKDHPILLGMPETEYLKCWILKLI